MNVLTWLNEKGFIVMDGYFNGLNGYMASVDFFEMIFFPSIANAETNGTSSHEAVMNTTGGTRGWEMYFDDWKQRGILN